VSGVHPRHSYAPLAVPPGPPPPDLDPTADRRFEKKLRWLLVLVLLLALFITGGNVFGAITRG
jgi:putative peptide zinc metalloprotease protein